MSATGCTCAVGPSGTFETRGCEVHTNVCECGHYHFNHRPNEGSCKVFVVRKGDSCWCTGFEPKGGRKP